jgi:hypothetical protein
MRSFLHDCCAKLKRRLRRSERQPPKPTSVVRSSSPEPLPVVLQREKALSVIFDTDLQLDSGDPKPRFLLLPYEIRRQIVEYCLCGIAVHLNVPGKGHRIEQIIYINPSDVTRKQKVLAISLTCRQLYVYVPRFIDSESLY